MSQKKIIPLLRNAVNTIMLNKIIFLPFCIVAFAQLLVLEVLYFMPRFPLKIFFGPIVSKLWAESYLHYPLNLVLLPKIFQYVQIPIFILLSSYCIAVLCNIIYSINNNKSISIKNVFKETSSRYVHVVVAAMISYLLVMVLINTYGLAVNRALQIQSESGIFYILKRIVLDGSPFFSLMISVTVTVLFAYVIPIIVLEQKRLFSAIINNFKSLWGNFWFTYIVVLVPSLFFVPVLLLRKSVAVNSMLPEVNVLMIVLSVIVSAVIDTIIYTSITSIYLLKREENK